MKEYKVFIINSKELKREVRVYVYLPKSYRKTDEYYPVLYMHDGQNLFDNKLAFHGKSWGIMEAYKDNPYLPEIIIVGIDSGETRTNELVPFEFIDADDKLSYGGDSSNYYDFITQTLKPFIDKRYRAFKSAKNTGIMGSSYGGLSSTYAAANYSKFFTRFGCVSNAYFPVQNDLEKLVEMASFLTVKKFYMDVGTKESENVNYCERYIRSNKAIYNIISEKIKPERLRFEIIEDAIHNESAWEIRFPEIIKFLFSD